MATFFLSPISTILQYFTDTGIPLSGGLIWTYAAGTSTPSGTWTDSTGSVLNSNPIQLNSAGRLNNVQIWQKGGVPLKVQISTNAGTPSVPVFGSQIGPTFDQIYGVGDPGTLINIFYGGNDTGVANAYVLNFTANFTSYTNGIVVYWVPSNTNSGASTININGLGAVSITNSDGSALSANQIIANQLTIIASQGGNFVLQSAAVQNGTFTPSWTGFSAAPTGNMSWQITGRQATIEWLGGTGTSNAASMTIGNLPSNLRPTSKSLLGMQSTIVIDNGNRVQGSVGHGSLGTLQFNMGSPLSGTGFTNVGTKGLDTGWSYTYLLN